MRHFTWILLLLFFGLNGIVNSQNLRALDNNNGFQNYKFGMSKSDFGECDFEVDDSISNEGAETCTILKSHKVGDLTFEKATLYFVDSQLKKIRVHSRNYNGRKVTSAIEYAFGSPTSRKSLNSIGSIRNVCWTANDVTLCHQFAASSLSGGYVVENSYYFEFYVNNYDDVLNEYNSRKYTPNDFN